MAARAKKNCLAKRFAHAISEHYRDFEHAYVYWIWLRGSASYVINMFGPIILLKTITLGKSAKIDHKFVQIGS